MKTTTLAVAAAMAAGTLAHAQDAVQWRVEDGGNGHWYLYTHDMSIGFGAAADATVAMGGHLACITTAEENAFVFAYLDSVSAWVDVRGPFLGGYQDLSSPSYSEPNGGWRWVTGEPWQYAGWTNGEPNNDAGLEHAVAMDTRFGTSVWNDVALNGHAGGSPNAYRTSTGYLTEWSADCNGDGIVDYGQILDGSLEDANGNGVPDCCDEGVSCDPCPGDVNFDGIVNGADISVLLGFWGLNGKPVAADINKDGSVDGADLAQLLGSWGECP